MQVSEQQLSLSQSLQDIAVSDTSDAAVQGNRPRGHKTYVRHPIYRWPRNPLEVLLILTRVDIALALSIPALCGAMLAWWHIGSLDGTRLLLRY